MRAPRFLYSRNPSRCCRERALIVQSRSGGFVSKNCLKCGKPDYVVESELPDCDCDICGRGLRVEKVDKQNYYYVCENCDRNWKVGDNIPPWDELFEYSGLAAGEGPAT